MAVVGAWDNEQGKGFDVELPPEGDRLRGYLRRRPRRDALAQESRISCAAPNSISRLFSPSEWAARLRDLGGHRRETCGLRARVASSVPFKNMDRWGAHVRGPNDRSHDVRPVHTAAASRGGPAPGAREICAKPRRVDARRADHGGRPAKRPSAFASPPPTWRSTRSGDLRRARFGGTRRRARRAPSGRDRSAGASSRSSGRA